MQPWVRGASPAAGVSSIRGLLSCQGQRRQCVSAARAAPSTVTSHRVDIIGHQWRPEFISVYGLWYGVPPTKGGTTYGQCTVHRLQARPTEFLDVTSVTLDEFQLLVPPFAATFQAHLREWRLDGKPRLARRFTVYENGPLPRPGDRLFFCC